MSDTSQNSRGPTFHVLKQGLPIGPLTEAELQAGLESGRFSLDDMVREDASPTWTRLSSITDATDAASASCLSDAPDAQPESPSLSAPDWSSLAFGLKERLRLDFAERPFALGIAALGLGLVLLLLTRWSFVLWLPWFAGAVTIGTLQVVSGRRFHGAVLVIIPVTISFFVMVRSVEQTPARPKTTTETDAALAEGNPPPLSPAKPASSPVAKAEPTSTPTAAAPVETASTAPASLVVGSAPPTASPASAATSAPSAAPPPSIVPELSSSTHSTPAPTGLGTRFSQWLTGVLNPPPPTTPEPAPAPTPATTPKPVAQAAPTPAPAPKPDLVQQHRNAFVVIQGHESAGSGFICRMGSTSWVFTNAHVAAGARDLRLTRLDGVQLSPGAAFAAGSRDVMRLTLTSDQPGSLEAISDFDKEVTIGDAVEVVGNSGGAGVVTNIAGEVVGIGPDRVEISAAFVPGNSGSPILHTKTGRVIGIATYLTKRREEFAEGAIENNGPVVIRRFGYRIDNVPQWEPVVWAAFQGEAERVRRIEMLTADIFDFLRGGSIGGIQSDTLRRAATEWASSSRKSQLSRADRVAADTRFLSELRGMVRSDVQAAEAQLRYGYFRERLRAERQIRDRLFEDLDKGVKQRASTAGRMQ